MEGYRSGHNGAVLKTVRAASSQGFESLTLRHKSTVILIELLCFLN